MSSWNVKYSIKKKYIAKNVCFKRIVPARVFSKYLLSSKEKQSNVNLKVNLNSIQKIVSEYFHI